jgi:hypothetical protein
MLPFGAENLGLKDKKCMLLGPLQIHELMTKKTGLKDI